MVDGGLIKFFDGAPLFSLGSGYKDVLVGVARLVYAGGGLDNWGWGRKVFLIYWGCRGWFLLLVGYSKCSCFVINGGVWGGNCGGNKGLQVHRRYSRDWGVCWGRGRTIKGGWG